MILSDNKTKDMKLEKSKLSVKCPKHLFTSLLLFKAIIYRSRKTYFPYDKRLEILKLETLMT